MGSCMILFLLTTLISFDLLCTSSRDIEGCESPQYLEMGKTGVIQCCFREDVYGVLWYRTGDYHLGTPIIKLYDNEISGYGYNFGEYDIYPNGSLIINHVVYRHERTFTAVKVDSLAEDVTHFHINVITIVKPTRLYPSINVCRRDDRSCFAQVSDTSGLRCSIWKARPAVHLQWFERTINADETIRCKLEVESYNERLTSHCTVTDSFQRPSLLSLLVCKANDTHRILLGDEAFALVEYNGRGDELTNEEPSKVVVELGSKMTLSCPVKKPHLIVWKQSRQLGDDFAVLAYGVFSKKTTLNKLYNNEYELKSNGSLVISKTKVQHGGFYGCSFQNEVAEGRSVFEVIVYVPAYPIVGGCTPALYCALEAQTEGNLTCSVTGIRPRVQLEWKNVYEYQSSVITFTERELTTNRNGEVFDIHLTSTYRIQPSSNNIVTVECAIVETDIEALKATAKLDLHIRPADQPTKGVTLSWAHAAIIISISICTTILIIVLLVCGIWCCCCRDPGGQLPPPAPPVATPLSALADNSKPTKV